MVPYDEIFHIHPTILRAHQTWTTGTQVLFRVKWTIRLLGWVFPALTRQSARLLSCFVMNAFSDESLRWKKRVKSALFMGKGMEKGAMNAQCSGQVKIKKLQ